MSHYYKAEAIYKAAVERGFEGHWDGSLASAINALVDTFAGEDVPVSTVDSLAFETMGGHISPTASGDKEITENGTVSVAGYSTATVNVPNPSTGTLEITENGTYDVTQYASVTVAIAQAQSEPGENTGGE